MNNIDDRIAAALHAAANQVTEGSLRPADPPRSISHSRVRWVAPLLAAAVVVGVAVAVTELSGSSPSAHHGIQPGTSTSQTPVPSGTSSAPNGQPTPASTTVPAQVAQACFFSDLGCHGVSSFYVPLFPFANYTQAFDAMTRDCVAPCVASAATVALNFTRKFLDFTDITRVTSSDIGRDEAHIGVGYLDPNGKPKTAAVLHLVRYEMKLGGNGPWEVVGSDDTTFSLETPAYGSTVGKQFSVGGHITGVDENISALLLRQIGGYPNSVGSLLVSKGCCVPAGGDNSPWTAPYGVRNNTPAGTVLTIVVSTGGHLQQHERFAIQGVYSG